MMRKALFLLLLFLCTGEAMGAAVNRGVVSHVYDGDTIRVGEEKIRLYGVDAPERTQAFGQEATDMVKQLVLGKTVYFIPHTKDRYGRTVATILISKSASRTLQAELVKMGAVWVYDAYCTMSMCSAWKLLEERARAEGKGLWQDKSAAAPWQWRQR